MKAKILTAILAIVAGVAFGQDCVTPYNPYEENSKGEVILTSCQSCQLTSSKVADLPMEFRGIMDKGELRELFIKGTTFVSISENRFSFFYPPIISKKIIYKEGNFNSENTIPRFFIFWTLAWGLIGAILFSICLIILLADGEFLHEFTVIFVFYLFVSFVMCDMTKWDYLNIWNLIVVTIFVIGLLFSYKEEKKYKNNIANQKRLVSDNSGTW